MTNPLVELQKLGQSIWYDNIRRGLLVSGELKQLIDDGEIRGVTSNPTIFEKAIAGSKDYDDALRLLVDSGLDAPAIFDALAIDDIRATTDLFRPVYEASNGGDGYVSIEVSPLLANDTATTLSEARRLWNQVDRSNLMVKIPATKEGVPAIADAIADGINVNVTLIFSLRRYEEVMDAYLAGLERRVARGEAIDRLASVASFFVSRVDTMIDPKLEAIVREEGPGAERAAALLGKAAIANAKLAYAQFNEVFASPRFVALQAAGARVQRPLWASTSTKNPNYPDTLYVENLIGPDTVNTMPPATIDAYRDHGQPRLTLEENLAEARAQIAALESLGIHMADVTQRLEVEGVAAFAKSFETLIAAIEKRRGEARPRPAVGGPRPEVGGPRPEVGGPRPEVGGPRPEVGGPRPEVGGPRPAVGGPRPAVGGPRPEVGGPRPEVGGPRPEVGGPRPEVGGPRPEVGGPRPEVGGPRPAAASPRPAAASLPKSLQAKVAKRLKQLGKDKFAERLWAKDPTLWTSDTSHHAEIRERLGWLTSPEMMRGRVGELAAFADEVRQAGFTYAALLGMGGSSLCPEVLRETFGVAPGHLDLAVLDSTDPAQVRAVEARSDPAQTLYLVASKSGGTVEPNMFFAYFWDKVRAVKGDRAGENFVAITDPGTKMERVAKEHGFRRVFLNPPDIGGRYSALSYFGLVPAALIGMDVGKLLDRAAAMVANSRPGVPAHASGGMWLGAILGEAALVGRDKLTLICSKELRTFGYWVEQLIAESTGKSGKGIVPVEGEPVGTPDQYGKDRLFVYLRLLGEGLPLPPASPSDAQAQALAAAGHPVVTLELGDLYDLGAEFFRWEIATAVAGSILRIDAFDQPNVQESKDNTVRLLGEYQKRGTRQAAVPSGKPVWQKAGMAIYADSAPAKLKSAKTLAGAMAAHLARVKPGDYVAFTAYLPRTAQSEEMLRLMRAAVRDRLKVATTVGYGPRFLHSTGQLHKGGANNGVFIQITAAPVEDLPIPREAATFGVLESAQAVGDLQSLQKRKRRAINIRLARPDELAGLAAALSEALAMRGAKPAKRKSRAVERAAKKGAAQRPAKRKIAKPQKARA